MKESEFEYEYDCNWDTVTSSFWKKYWHPKCSHSRALVLNRYIDEDGNLVTKRLHVVRQEVPRFIEAIVGNVATYAGEESIANPVDKTLTLRTKNLSFNCMVTVDELCKYNTSNTKLGRTDYSKRLIVQGWVGCLMNTKVESWYIDTDKRNRGTGISVMDEIMHGISQLLIPINKIM